MSFSGIHADADPVAVDRRGTLDPLEPFATKSYGGTFYGTAYNYFWG